MSKLADVEWIDALPTLEGLFAKHTSTLLRPFSLFNISLFRSSPQLPPTSLLDPLRSLTEVSSSSDPTSSPKGSVYKALISLQTYIAQLRDAVRHKNLPLTDDAVLDRVGELLEGYMMGTYLIARTLWPDQGVENQDLGTTETNDLKRGFEQCLRGFFAGRSMLLDPALEETTKANIDSIVRRTNNHLLGSIFPPTETTYPYFAPLLAHPRKVITTLQTNPTRPVVSHSKIKSPSPISPTTPVPHQTVSDEEVSWFIAMLKIFEEGLETIDSIPLPQEGEEEGQVVGKQKKKTKAQEQKELEEDKCRPLRLEMEVRVLACDLAMSMTTKRMGEVKARALAKMDGDQEVHSDDQEKKVSKKEQEENEEEDGGEQSPSPSEVDIKPRLSFESDLDPSPSPKLDDAERTRSPETEKIDALQAARWEEIAEDLLVRCLETARSLVDDGRGEVLVEHVVPEDWLGEDGIPSPSLNEKDNKFKSLIPDPTTDNSDKDHRCQAESDADSESEFDDTSSDSESEDLSSGPSHPCPLRSLFRLHDRYEEQRLAIWLHLPSAHRGKMGLFMRGSEGRVGKAWDTLGLGLMIEYDSETLIGYGLGGDKLDKWLELAAARNTKKIRRRGRKTV
ncbi:hypothetical protein CI109_100765 [Kwoniella shandongensis]|uniref:Uncharacterized protein n=1 Tax=Kwoniella shandongensis TaxID=1734106 RepID=A0A5M6BYZ7_9TREE|nr:uncharacterized protein CI109_005055 [Kwoniella shandongensis]KAA5526665.1 hypothetical protein CI109_005055 [Kwoniella shandongensis]